MVAHQVMALVLAAVLVLRVGMAAALLAEPAAQEAQHQYQAAVSLTLAVAAAVYPLLHIPHLRVLVGRVALAAAEMVVME